MGKSKWMKLLNKMDGAVNIEYDPYNEENLIRSTSPSLNWIFGRGHGLPFGQSAICFGPPKAGKSLIANLFIAGLHKDSPEAEVVKFNTEMRESTQSGQSDLIKWGIDPNRYQGFDVNEPQLIFDRITNEFEPMLQEGWPLKLIIIDSMEGVEGVKAANKTSILDHLIGDHALTIGEGLKRILPIIRRYKIAIICTSHVRANIGAMGHAAPKTKMAGGYAQKHWFEYYIEVKGDKSAEGKSNAIGEKFESEIKDFKGNKTLTGHKIWCKMLENSVGVAGRSGQFTINYNSGIVNIEDELFELAKNLNIVERPNNRTYTINNQTFSSKGDFIKAIKEQEIIKKQILTAVYKKEEE